MTPDSPMLLRLSPRHGWRGWLQSSNALWYYFRGAEYPMGRIEAAYEAAKLAWRWP